jgi:competence protein ComEC
MGVYAALLFAGAAGLWWRRAFGRLLLLAALVCGAMAGAGLAGWRAVAYANGALDPSLEGRDLRVTGVVSQMPQRNETGTRFHLDVESVRWADARNDAPPTVPARIALGWYGENTGIWGHAVEGRATSSAVVGELHAGERWQLTVRLRAPHGNLNPHGFDSELWLWEQGVHANGYVRTGTRDAAPVYVANTWRHPIERAREAVRDAVFERVTDRNQAGVIAALVTGDQRAIDRAGWDVFRATGVAHLMSISGLHITMFAWLAAQVVGALWRRSGRLMLRLPAPQAGIDRRRAARHALCALQRLGRARAAHRVDARHHRLAAPHRPALAVAACLAVDCRGGGGARSLGADAGGLLAQLRRGGRALRHRFVNN